MSLKGLSDPGSFLCHTISKQTPFSYLTPQSPVPPWSRAPGAVFIVSCVFKPLLLLNWLISSICYGKGNGFVQIPLEQVSAAATFVPPGKVTSLHSAQGSFSSRAVEDPGSTLNLPLMRSEAPGGNSEGSEGSIGLRCGHSPCLSWVFHLGCP